MGIRTAILKPTRQRWEGQLVRFAPYIAGGVILIILPFLLPSFYQGIMTKALILAIFAMSLGLLIGYIGLFSFGHAAFFGVGGYVVGALMMHYGTNSFWITAPSGILAALLVAGAFGFIVVRFSGIYFLLLTFAFGQLLFSIAWRWNWLRTPGAEAIIGIPHPDLGIPGFAWNAINFYFFNFFIFIICFFLLYRIVNSPFGRALQGIHENEPRMRHLGYNTWLYKYIAYMVAGLFAGVGGVLFAYERGFVVPAFLGAEYSWLVILMVILGGSGMIFGPVIGAGLIVFGELLLSLTAPERWPLIMGAVLVVTIMFLRGGIAPHLFRLWKKGCYRYGSNKG